jgi:hypothetical protein
MSAAEVIEQAHRSAGGTWWPGAHDHAAVASHILDALQAAGYAIVELPSVAHKGPNDTDASMFRRAANNLENGRYIGGGNVQAAIIRLLRSAADAAEAGA